MRLVFSCLLATASLGCKLFVLVLVGLFPWIEPHLERTAIVALSVFVLGVSSGAMLALTVPSTVSSDDTDSDSEDWGTLMEAATMALLVLSCAGSFVALLRHAPDALQRSDAISSDYQREM